jgi:hypothetical protein
MVDPSRFLTVADDAVDHLRNLIRHFPHLVTPEVKAAIEHWDQLKERRGRIEFVKPFQKTRDRALWAKKANELIEDHPMEEVMEILEEEFSIKMDYPRLIGLIGKVRYRHALRNESRVLQHHAISFQQMADLWNSLGKPPMGGERWTAHSISLLVE